MRWWSDCTAKWREKWSKTRNERNIAREEIKLLKTEITKFQKQPNRNSKMEKNGRLSWACSTEESSLDPDDGVVHKSNEKAIGKRISITSSGWEEAFQMLQVSFMSFCFAIDRPLSSKHCQNSRLPNDE